MMDRAGIQLSPGCAQSLHWILVLGSALRTSPTAETAAILSSPFAFTVQRCRLKLPPTIPFSSSAPKAVEFWVEPDEPAMGLFWIKRRRGEFQLCGLRHPLPALALVLARMLQLASSGLGQHGLGTSTNQRLGGYPPALIPANVR